MTRPLNFCMITTFYPPYNFGGDGIFIYRLSNELARRGHSVDIIHCKDSYLMLAPGGPKGDYPNHPNITVHGLKSRWGFLSPLLTQQTGYPLLKNKKIEGILGSKKFDVIHYHNISLIGGPGLLRPRNEITLYTMHEHWLVCPMHVLWKYNREVCVKKRCFLCTLVWRRPPQLWRYTNILKRSLRNVDYFISPSRFTLKKHLEMGLDIPIKHIPYFLPMAEDKKCEPGSVRAASLEKPYFLFVGRLEKIKGVQNLIPVFRHYDKAELVVAGDGDYGEELRRMGDGINGIRFLGRVNHSELRHLYRDAIAVIVPSICYEVFGIIILEAFSMKTPVIVNNLGALPDVVEESGGGFIYNNKEELIEAMEVLRTRPHMRKELGDRGYRAWRELWTEEYGLKLYFNLITEVAKKKKIDLEPRNKVSAL